MFYNVLPTAVLRVENILRCFILNVWADIEAILQGAVKIAR